MKRFGIFEAAVSCGSPTRGTEGAYDALMAAGLGDLFPGSRYPMEKRTPCGTYPPGLRHLDTVMAVSRELRANVLTGLQRGEFPVVIGGDHSVAMGSLAALGEFYGAEQVAVVYIDAHTDINTEESSASGCIHGMDLAAACGLCGRELQVGENRVNVLGKNLYILGARSIDPPEYEIMERQGVNLYTAQRVREMGLDKALEEVLGAIRGKRVHVSFDVDVLDPAAFTATGYNIPGGFTPEEAARTLEAVLGTGDACALECVEYNPTLDPDGRDRRALMELLRRGAKALG